MARINVEDDILRNPRFQALVRRLGGDTEKAIGRLVRFWWAAQRHWGQNRNLVPLEEFALGDFDGLVEVGLAEIRANGVYAKGAEKHFEWYEQRIAAARAGGLKSASVRSEKYGTALPLHARNAPKQNRSGASVPVREIAASTEANPNALTLTPVPSPSQEEKYSPNGESQDSTVLARVPFQDFAKAWTDNCGVLSPKKNLKLTDERRRKIRARWAEHPDLAYWADCARRMAASSFCCEGPWATFDWLIKNDTNHVKVAEGKYDNRGSGESIDWSFLNEEGPQ